VRCQRQEAELCLVTTANAFCISLAASIRTGRDAVGTCSISLALAAAIRIALTADALTAAATARVAAASPMLLRDSARWHQRACDDTTNVLQRL